MFEGLLLIVAPLVGWWLNHLPDIIIWATGVILLIYTLETQAMRLEAEAEGGNRRGEISR